MKLQWKGLDTYQKAVRAMQRDLAKLEPVVKDAVLGTQRQARIEAPVDTGRLRASIMGEIVSGDRVVQGVVSSNVVYAPYQEFGTRFIYPRRYLGNAFDAMRDKFQQAFKEFVKGVLKK
jgi:HK97 gp10 family phage protein